MRLGQLAYLYLGWVRAKPAREALAALGIAVGVALVFATITANLSIGSSATRIIDGLAGSAQLRAVARDPSGIPERSLSVQGSDATASALQAPVAISHAGHLVSAQMIGAGPGIVTVNSAIANVPPSEGLTLPVALASAVRAAKGAIVTVFARGRAVRMPVRQVLGPETIGPLAQSLVAFGPLGYVQKLLGLPGRITTVLVRVQPGKLALARESLARAVGPSMRVTGATDDATLLKAALRPQDQATSFFVLLGCLVGILLVVTTTMLSAADRRQELVELRLLGYAPRALRKIVLFQGFALGSVASALGILGGYALALGAFHSNPDYLASAFPLGSETVVSVPLAVAVWFGGLIATCLCVGSVLVGKARGSTLRGSTQWKMFAFSLMLLAVSLSIVARASLLAALLLAVALLFAVPACLDLTVRLADLPVRSRMLRQLPIAAGSIRAARIRSIGLATTAAIGVFGATVAQGSHHDLLQGLETGYSRYVGSADVWITSPSDDLATNSFPSANLPSRIAKVHGVKSARPYYGGWIDMAGRRLWLIARDSPKGVLPVGEIVRGQARVAEKRLREGDWVAISDQLAQDLHLDIGSQISIPTPVGRKAYRVAATTTNLGWSSGLVFLSASDYKRYWGSTPTAIEVDVQHGYERSVLQALRRTAGPGLRVQASSRKAAVADKLPRQGLVRLSQIAWLLVIAVTIAVALAMVASIWQRRNELAALRLQSHKPRQIQAVLAWEAILVVLPGALIGALAGAYGHFAADKYLRVSTGYPVAWSLGLMTAIVLVLLVVLVTAMILAAPGRIAARTPMRLALVDGR